MYGTLTSPIEFKHIDALNLIVLRKKKVLAILHLLTL